MKIESDKQVVLLNNLAKSSSVKGGSDTQSSAQNVSDTGDKVELSSLRTRSTVSRTRRRLSRTSTRARWTASSKLSIRERTTPRARS